MGNHLRGTFFGVPNPNSFALAMQGVISQVPGNGVFAGDNLFAFGRNLGFLDDGRFMAAMERHAQNDVEKSAIWRIYVLCWAAKRALQLDGDFVECGCSNGTSARVMIDYVGFESSSKQLYLYDLFQHGLDPNDPSLPQQSAQLFDQVQKRFASFSNVHVVQGEVPKSFEQSVPEKIAFLHIDMINAAAAIGVLERIYDRVEPGAVIVFNEYGWRAYREQKLAEDRFFDRVGQQILEIPTGQGILIK
jgi:O-methyltransferase